MKSRFSFVLAGSVFLQFVVGAQTHATTTINRDFETKSLTGLRVSGNSPAIESKIRRLGYHGMRSVLDRYSSPVPYRTEARVIAADPLVGKEYWYGFSVYLPTDFVPDLKCYWELIAQWHSNPDDGDKLVGPPIALSSNRGEWQVINRSTGTRILKDASDVRTRTFSLGKYVTGRWTNWVFRVKWSYGTDGILEVWKNGVKVISAKGPNTFNDARMPFFKMGIYKGWKAGMPSSVTRRVVYHDQFRMVGPGGSYTAVAPASNPYSLAAPSTFTAQ